MSKNQEDKTNPYKIICEHDPRTTGGLCKKCQEDKTKKCSFSNQPWECEGCNDHGKCKDEMFKKGECPHCKLKEDKTNKDWEKEVEKLSVKFHEIYQKEAVRQGDVRHAEKYEYLPENIKEFDRVLARYVLTIINQERESEYQRGYDEGVSVEADHWNKASIEAMKLAEQDTKSEIKKEAITIIEKSKEYPFNENDRYLRGEDYRERNKVRDDLIKKISSL